MCRSLQVPGWADVRKGQAVQIVQVVTYDDLTPDIRAAETVAFAMDGQAYEIDLTDGHAKELREAFTRFITAGRKAKPVKVPQRVDRREIRQWLRDRNYKVGDYGKIPAEMMAVWRSAHR